VNHSGGFHVRKELHITMHGPHGQTHSHERVMNG
jgi:hypothetical protein